MPKNHRVRGGECIASIGEAYGFFPDTIWNDAANRDLKQQRGDPFCLHPGDVVVIPDLREHQASGADGKRHRFRRKGVPERLCIAFSALGQPRANEPYSLTIDGQWQEGQTDADGFVDCPIPPGAKSGKIRFHASGDEIELTLGTLSPVNEDEGMLTRLRNLGYVPGSGGGDARESMQVAILEFQRRNDLNVTGTIDDDTRDALEREHDGAE